MPALQRLSIPSKSTGRSKGPRVLVLTPTRELANQITEAVKTYGKFMRIRSGAILGGMPYFEQQRLLVAARGPHRGNAGTPHGPHGAGTHRFFPP